MSTFPAVCHLPSSTSRTLTLMRPLRSWTSTDSAPNDVRRGALLQHAVQFLRHPRQAVKHFRFALAAVLFFLNAHAQASTLMVKHHGSETRRESG